MLGAEEFGEFYFFTSAFSILHFWRGEFPPFLLFLLLELFATIYIYRSIPTFKYYG